MSGILFKLQTDWKGIYGGDFNAMKTGGLELKGLMRYYGREGIHVPMMAVIDYRGFRLVAMSKLPINDTTLVYGSADGGKTVVASHPEACRLMEQAGKANNLIGHLCGRNKSALHEVYGPTDIEGHYDAEHDRLYVLDFARVFPPTAEDDVKKSFLYKVFRPEFVKKYPVPLSSDAFSPFSRFDPARLENDQNVMTATQQLLSVVIPRFARWLESHWENLKLDKDLTNLTEIIHREGINVRYLGLLRSHVQNETLRNLILIEMIARVIKNRLRDKLRRTMRNSVQTLIGDAFLEVVLTTFNRVLGWHDRSTQFWKIQLKKHLMYFSSALDEAEKMAEFDLKRIVNMRLLFTRMRQLTNVKLSRYAVAEFNANVDGFKLVIADILGLHVKVKKMNTISLAEGNALAIQGMEALSTTGSRHHDRLLRLAMTKFDSAIQATPDNTHMLNHYADILTRVAVLKAKAGETACEYFAKALEKYRIAGNYQGLLQLGNTINQANVVWSERDASLTLANRCYGSVLRQDSLNTTAFACRGELLLKKAHFSRQPDSYVLGGEMFRRAIELTPVGTFEWISEWYHLLDDFSLGVIIELLHYQQPRIHFDASVCSINSAFNDSLVRLVVEHVPTLTSIDLSNCPNVSDDAMAALARYCYNLTHLRAARCSRITDAGIGQIATIKALQALDISHCPNISDYAFKLVTSKCSVLTDFVAPNCLFTGAHIVHLEWLASSNLRVLDISGSPLHPEVWIKVVPFPLPQPSTPLPSFYSLCSHLVR